MRTIVWLDKKRFTARLIWDVKLFSMNGCWKKSRKLIRRFGSRCNKPSKRLWQSDEIRASCGILKSWDLTKKFLNKLVSYFNRNVRFDLINQFIHRGKDEWWSTEETFYKHWRRYHHVHLFIQCIPKRMTPIDHRSTRLSYGREERISGAMYNNVPRILRLPCLPICCDTPKSI